jgi:hypothetical protein
MDKKISSSFAIIVILIIASFIAFIFLLGSNNMKSEFSSSGNTKNNKKSNSQVCSRHAFEGEAKIKTWYVDENGKQVLRVADENLNDLPPKYESPKVELADGSSKIIQNIKKASAEKPAEVTIKGYYFNCEGNPMVSIAPGGEVFKKYLDKS